MFLPPQDKAVLAHTARKGELQMKFEFIKTVRNSFRVGTEYHKTLDSILNTALDHQEVTQRQMDYVAALYAKH